MSEKVINELLQKAAELFHQALLASPSTTLTPSTAQGAAWKEYLLLSMLVLCATLIVQVIRGLITRQEAFEKEIRDHLAKCDKAPKETVADMPDLKISVAKCLSVCSKEFGHRYGEYLYNDEIPVRDIHKLTGKNHGEDSQ